MNVHRVTNQRMQQTQQLAVQLCTVTGRYFNDNLYVHTPYFKVTHKALGSSSRLPHGFVKRTGP